MKKLITGFVFAILLSCLVILSSCDPGGKTKPQIGFRITTDTTNYIVYEPVYKSFPRDSIFSLYVNAIKVGPDGMLHSFKITKSINGGADTTLINASLNTVNFEQRYSYQTGDSGDLEVYTFTVGNDLGETSSIQFTDTVK